MAEAVQNSGSIADEAGLQFETYAAIVGKIAEVTRQDGSSIGNTLKTTMARLSRSKSADADVTDDDRSNAAKAFGSIGISLYDENGKYQDLSKTLDQLSVKWKDMTDAERNYIAEQAAGTRGLNVFTALMNTYDDAKMLAKDALEDTDFANTVQEKHLESIQGKQERLKATTQDFWNSLLSSDMVGTVMDAGNNLVGVLDNVVGALNFVDTGVLHSNKGFVTLAGTIGSLVAGINTIGGVREGKGIWSSLIDSLKDVISVPMAAGKGSWNILSDLFGWIPMVLTKNQDNKTTFWGNKAKELSGNQLSGLKSNALRIMSNYGLDLSKLNPDEKSVESLEDAQKIISKLGANSENSADSIQKATKAMDAFADTSTSVTILGKTFDRGLLPSMKAAASQSKVLRQSGMSLKETWNEVGKSGYTGLSSLAGKGAAITSSIPILSSMSGLGGLVAGGAAIVGLAGLTAGIKYLVEEPDRIRKNTEESIAAYKEEMAKVGNIRKTLAEITPEWSSLAAGIDSKTGENISLTVSEFERYQQLSQQLAEMNPSIVTGYDKFNNVIIDQANALAMVNKQLEQTSYQQASKVLADSEKYSNIAFKDIKAKPLPTANELDAGIPDTTSYLELGLADRKKLIEKLMGISTKDLSNGFLQELNSNDASYAIHQFGLKADMDAQEFVQARAKMTVEAQTVQESLDAYASVFKDIMDSQLTAIQNSTDGAKLTDSQLTKLQSVINKTGSEQLISLAQKNISPDTYVQNWVDKLTSPETSKQMNQAMSQMLSLDADSTFDEISNFVNNGLKSIESVDGVEKDTIYDLIGLGNLDEALAARQNVYRKALQNESQFYSRLTSKGALNAKDFGATEIFGDGKNDLFGSAKVYTSKDGERTFVYTPVLPDGTVVDRDNLDNYLENVATGGKDDQGLILRTFKGKNHLKEARKFQKSIQEMYKGLGKSTDTVQKMNSLMNELGVNTANEANLLANLLDKYKYDLNKVKSAWDGANYDFSDQTGKLQELLANLDSVKQYYSDLQNAINQSNSASGMDKDAINAIDSRYSTLKDYNYDKLFEGTAMGVRMNAEELRKLHKEYKDFETQKYDNQIKDLEKAYASLNRELAEADNTADRNFINSKIASVKNQISEAQELQSMFEGITNQVHEWQQAASGSEKGDLYDTITSSGIASAKKLYEAHDVGTNEFRAFANMITNKDLTSATTDEIIDAYEKGIGTINRWFQEDTNQGLINFLTDLNKLGGNGAAELDSEGNWNINKANMDLKEMAELLDVDTSLVQVLMDKLADKGFEMGFAEADDYLQGLRKDASAAHDALSEATKEKYKIDMNADSLDEVSKNIEELEKAKLDIDANANPEDFERIQTMLDYFLAKKGELISVGLAIDGEQAVKSAQESLEGFNKTYKANVEVDWTVKDPEYYRQKMEDVLNETTSKPIKVGDEGYQDARNTLDNLYRQAQAYRTQETWEQRDYSNDPSMEQAQQKAKAFQEASSKLKHLQELESNGVQLNEGEWTTAIKNVNSAYDDLKKNVSGLKKLEGFNAGSLIKDAIGEDVINDTISKMNKGVKKGIEIPVELKDGKVDSSTVLDIIDKLDAKDAYEYLVSIGVDENEIEDILGEEAVKKVKLEYEEQNNPDGKQGKSEGEQGKSNGPEDRTTGKSSSTSQPVDDGGKKKPKTSPTSEHFNDDPNTLKKVQNYIDEKNRREKEAADRIGRSLNDGQMTAEEIRKRDEKRNEIQQKNENRDKRSHPEKAQDDFITKESAANARQENDYRRGRKKAFDDQQQTVKAWQEARQKTLDEWQQQNEQAKKQGRAFDDRIKQSKKFDELNEKIAKYADENNLEQAFRKNQATIPQEEMIKNFISDPNSIRTMELEDRAFTVKILADAGELDKLDLEDRKVYVDYLLGEMPEFDDQDREVIVDYIAQGKSFDQIDLEDQEVMISYWANTGQIESEIKNLTDEQIAAHIDLIADTSAWDNFEPEDKKAYVEIALEQRGITDDLD